MSITIEQLQALGEHGKVVTDQGDKVGAVGAIYLDDATGAPSWVTVRTGLFGTAESFVPVDAARLDGDDVVVPYAKDLVKHAPRVDADGSLSPEEEQALYRHYGLGTSAGTVDTGRTGRTVGHDRAPSTSGTDAEVVLHEERLTVGTQTREAGRARLRKHVVTERVTQTVPVRHEEARVVREPITDANRGDRSPVIGEEVREVVLHAETPVVEKHVVAVERVRVGTTTVTGEQTVSAEVRKEEVELDDATVTSAAAGTSKGTAAGRNTSASTGKNVNKHKGTKNRR